MDTNSDIISRAFDNCNTDNRAQAMESWIHEYLGSKEVFERWGHYGLQRAIFEFLVGPNTPGIELKCQK